MVMMEETGEPRALMLPKPTSRFAVVDLLRSISIAIVVFGHSATVSFAMAGWPGWLQGRLEGNSAYGVTIFFVVSGFIITKTISIRSPNLSAVSSLDFYGRRVARLLPLAMVVVLTAAVLAHLTHPGIARDFVLRDPQAQFSGWFFVSLPLFAFNWVRIAYQSIASGWGLQWDIFWSLAIEEQFYLLYPFILRRFGGSAARLVRVMALVVGIGILYRLTTSLVAPTNFWLGFSGSPSGFESIAFGVMAFLASTNPRIRNLGRKTALGMALGFAVLAFCVFWGLSLAQLPLTRVYAPTLLSLAIAGILTVARTRPWANRMPQFLTLPGALCYGMYLLHPLVIFLLLKLLGQRSAPVFTLLTFVTTLIIAWLSFRLFEAPASLFLRARLPRRRVSSRSAYEPAPAP